jgi:hypothetical protein
MTTPKGMLPSANNRTGVQQIDVALDASTAKTYTHNFGAYPAAVQVFLDGTPVESTGVAVTMSANSITLTPNAVMADTYTVLITWAPPSEIIAGAPATNFV